MSKGGSQTVTQELDPQTRYMRDQVYGTALGAAGMGGQANPYANERGWLGDWKRRMWEKENAGLNAAAANAPQAAPVPGVDPLTEEAIGGYRGMAELGNLGLGALGGDADAMARFWNPYEDQVLDRIAGRYGDMASAASNTINDQATRAGAFGGSRHGVATGQALGDIAKGQADTMANAIYGGWTDMMGRAGAAANLGLGANNAMAGMGDYRRQVEMSQDPALRRLAILQGAMGGMPSGLSTTHKQSTDPMTGLLGLATTGAGIASGLGWAPFAAGAAGGMGGVSLPGFGINWGGA